MKLSSRINRLGLVFFSGLWLGLCVTEGARGDGFQGKVYTLSNAEDGNQLVVFDRQRDGGLSFSGTVATGGTGLGSGLGSQGAVILGGGGRTLYAVNAGSNNLSVFNLGKRSPQLIQMVDSAGMQPISLTAFDNALYVLNQGSAAGGVDQISGFRIHRESQKLVFLNGSTQGLSAGSVGPAQVGFNAEGNVLVVTEKMTNNIDTFQVSRSGLAGTVHVQPSSGMTPYGFGINSAGFLVVSEAFGGVAGAGDVSSYQIHSSTGLIHVESASVPTFQTAPCWIAITSDGRYAYSSNTGSGTVTGFRIQDNGKLVRIDGNGVTGVTGGAAIDAATVGNQYLYVLSTGHSGGQSAITAFAINGDGSLNPIGTVSGLPSSTVGMAAR